MKAERLGGNTYKITLERAEARDIPADGEPVRMRSFISAMIHRLSSEHGVDIPEGRLLTEVFICSDGGCVFFISALETVTPAPCHELYACDLEGVGHLRSLCLALAEQNVPCSVYCGSIPDRYRILFSDPDPEVRRICAEYGEYCEISPLFAAQTKEYLTEIAAGDAAATLSQILG